MNDKLSCNKCGCQKVKKLISGSFAVTFTNIDGTSKRDSFSYMAGHNMTKSHEERLAAIEAGQDPNPYGD